MTSNMETTRKIKDGGTVGESRRRSTKITWLPLAALMMVAMFAGCAQCSPAVCDCAHHVGGCVINLAAPTGFKCRCSHRVFWSCSGKAFPCVGTEACPGNLADYCACKLGKGNCGGYYKHPVTCCEDCGKPKKGVAGKAHCSCAYSSGGCTIYEPAPFGWKCVCVKKGFWNCNGWPQQCEANEACLGNDYSYCGCKQGSGNCGGYPDKPSCSSRSLSTACNCNRGADWNKGLYTIDDVTYDFNHVNIDTMTPIALAKKEIPNHSGEIQSITFTVREEMGMTSFFSNTAGLEIASNVGFEASIPLISKISGSMTITSSFSHTYGKTESFTKNFESSFTCNGSPYKHTRCTVSMQRAKLTVPYTMTVTHKLIPNCACESYGTWKGVQAFNAKLSSTEIGTCNKGGCR